MKGMKYLSLFSGIGGFELGIGGRAECIGFSEINPYSISIYEHHFPNHKNFGDIRRIDPKELPPFDLLVGGFPCQAFSIAGRRKGFDDPRGALFFEIVRIVRQAKPRLLFFENVKGLVNHEGGKTFAAILGALDEVGYDCQWQVLNSKDFGLPQSRERVYIVGHLRGTPRPEVFPVCGEGSEGHMPREPSKTIGLNSMRIRNASPEGYALAEVGDCIDLSYPSSTTRRGRVGRGISHTVLPGMELYTLAREGRLRRLTPLEIERLQGFPDRWTAEGVRYGNMMPISDTQRYKCLGNAVSVPVVDAIVKRLLRE
jgi:DNA (cytosine-5)-methyltransferase 1